MTYIKHMSKSNYDKQKERHSDALIITDCPNVWLVALNSNLVIICLVDTNAHLRLLQTTSIFSFKRSV